MNPIRAAVVALATVGIWATAAQAASVTLTGTIGGRAILIVDGAAPRTVAPGEKLGNVRLVSVQGDQAVVEVDGQRIPLRMDSPVSVGASAPRASGTRIVLPANSGGHFLTQGTINGRSVNFMLDTGATVVAISAADAVRIGLDYKKGQPVRINTANGDSSGYRLKLGSIRVGDVEVYDVDAIVSEQPMPYVLLGNSFIGRFSMQRDADQMVLEKRY
ncbi:TIGR02281 family clan AA aspartic protease [Variovorax sp. J22R133]|uniref:retropepsin-like aspartic protease family protein n=1 Tax=Variovorax brevis TaxID=3053503 RepID=UPI0025760725|nr:TIGR02281 family clan AA aspartic protease [Variovorax sp. J22R133]MDM0111865.1 TIGR02281 family clan AA aspartic protease [Variovorax sp. J22R133]